MKHFFTFCLLFFILSFAVAQPQQDLYNTAKSLMKEGDYENATLVLYKLLLNEPNNIAAQKDYAFANYYKKDYKKSIEIAKQLIKDSTTDDQIYQILGMNYKALGLTKDCNKTYREAIVKFNNAGFFYNEIGELFFAQNQTDSAVKYWEKGIESDPNYATNYYNAAMYYSRYSQPFWAAIYGEVFVNLESYTVKTAEVKQAIIDAYRKILYQSSLSINSKNKFEKKVIETIGNTNETLIVNTLTAIRTKFILSWFYEKNNETLPYKLFEHQRFLIQQGMFDAYNQWLFGVVLNPIQYKIWVDAHKVEANAFETLQQNKVFKLTVGEYYKL
ncbi:MAG: hypothetical protein NTZ59_05725 [Bacteroidetes bacterium]|jgi:hypothetical protein|nr:hypothetical protein [Bacteroidota bacterium]